ncbi:MAG TPA: hypothetical protein VN956_00100 [Pyrinomonadaceae bacterium]|nr:hypothetical protein [Pyrinomonadaceae bacterium]
MKYDSKPVKRATDIIESESSYLSLSAVRFTDLIVEGQVIPAMNRWAIFDLYMVR